MPKKRAYYHPWVTFEEELPAGDPDPIAVEFEARATKVGNTGIGPYEFQGRKGFDKGQEVVDEFKIAEIRIDGFEVDEDSAKAIERWIRDDEALCEKIETSLLEARSDMPEPEMEEMEEDV